jgi:hypothetical protein
VEVEHDLVEEISRSLIDPDGQRSAARCPRDSAREVPS